MQKSLKCDVTLISAFIFTRKKLNYQSNAQRRRIEELFLKILLKISVIILRGHFFQITI